MFIHLKGKSLIYTVTQDKLGKLSYFREVVLLSLPRKTTGGNRQ